METKTTGLGDQSLSNLTKIRQKFPLPSDRKMLIAAFSDIVSMGLVQKVNIEVGRDILVERFITDKEAPPGVVIVTEEDEPLYNEALRSPIKELEVQTPNDGLVSLSKACLLLVQDGFAPKVIIVNDLKKFFVWVNSDAQETCFGYPILQGVDLPDDVVLFIGESDSGLETIKLIMEPKKTKRKKNG